MALARSVASEDPMARCSAASLASSPAACAEDVPMARGVVGTLYPPLPSKEVLIARAIAASAVAQAAALPKTPQRKAPPPVFQPEPVASEATAPAALPIEEHFIGTPREGRGDIRLREDPSALEQRRDVPTPILPLPNRDELLARVHQMPMTPPRRNTREESPQEEDRGGPERATVAPDYAYWVEHSQPQAAGSFAGGMRHEGYQYRARGQYQPDSSWHQGGKGRSKGGHRHEPDRSSSSWHDWQSGWRGGSHNAHGWRW